LEPTSPDALYRQLMNRLRADILAGRYGPSGKLPTEFELCEIYGLSRTPVARALRDLADAGVVVRHRRRGTFVNPGWLSSHTSAQPALRVLGPGPTWAAQVRGLVPGEIPLDMESPGLGDLHDIFRQQIAEGRGPDLVVVDSVWVAEFARAHFLTPLTELDSDGWLAQALADDFLPPFGEAYRHDGSVVAVQAPADVTGLWYARSALTEPPRTWSQLRTAGLSLLRAGDWESVLTLPGGLAGGETTTYALVALLAANGASVLRDAAVTLDSPAAVEAMAFLRQLVDDGIVPAKAAEFAGHEGVQLFAEGHAAMCVGASYQAEDIAAWAGIKLEDVLGEFGFVPLPGGPSGDGPGGGVLAGGMAYAIPRQSAHPELALSLLRTLTSTDVLVRQCLQNGQLPPRRSALDQVTAESAFHAATGELLRRAILRPVTPAYALVSDQLQAMISDVITRRARPAAAVSHAAETISAVTRLPLA
jgi:multiple sugar transport system substrate-binding protein